MASAAWLRAYETNVRELCDQELPAVEDWPVPAPQPGPQATVAERVRREMWALKIAWLRAMRVARAYVFTATLPPEAPLFCPAPSEVVNAASSERTVETRLRREWGVKPAMPQ